MASRHVIYVPVDGGRTLRGAWVVSATGLPMDPRSSYAVKVGLSTGKAAVTWLGEWDGAKQPLGAARPMRVTGVSDLGVKLGASSLVVADLIRYGPPRDLGGLAVQALIGTQARVPRHRADDPGSDTLSDHISGTGAGDQVVTVALRDHPPVTETYQYYGTTQTVSSTTFVDGGTLVTLIRPAWASIGHVHAATEISFTCSSAAVGGLYTAIGDGATDHNSILSVCPDNADTDCVVSSASFDIRDTTTIRGRVKKLSGYANIDIYIQSLSVSVTWE